MKSVLLLISIFSSIAFFSTSHAQICKKSIIASATSTFFEINQSHSLLDKRTRIIWSRCSHGQIWDNQQCIGSATTLSFTQARLAARNQATQEKQAWRLPTVSELSLLVELRCHDPAIDLDLFPNTPVGNFWTSTRFVNKVKQHWQVQFKFGANLADKDINRAFVRLVRDK